MRSLVLPFACAVVVAAAPRAHADPKSDAQLHVDRAGEAHKAGKYKVALDELNTAYTLDPRPELLYAIGQLHVKLDQCDDAITFYERFLATNPDAGPAGAATEAIATCKQRGPRPVGKLAPTRETPEIPPPLPPQPSRRSSAFFHDGLGDAMMFGAIALAVGAVVEYQDALHSIDLAGGASSYHDFSSYTSDAQNKRLFAVAGGFGAGALVVGAVLHYRRFVRGRSEPHVTVIPTPRGAAIAFGLGF